MSEEEPEELTSFESLSEDLRASVNELGWSDPMPVQARVIPRMRAGKDLMVQAVTGSGKTGAFGLPILESIEPELKAIQGMVLAPTRELAGQVARRRSRPSGKTRGDARRSPSTAASPMAHSSKASNGAPTIVVGTPGRILDHLGAGRMKSRRR